MTDLNALPDAIETDDIIYVIEGECTACGTVNTINGERRGNSALEIILWLFAALPGLIYSLWRFKGRVYICPACSCTSVKRLTPEPKAIVPTFMREIIMLFVIASILIAFFTLSATMGAE